MRTISVERARRISLAAQGFRDAAPKGNVTERHFRRARDRMTILQLDSVNVLARSHFLPMFARLGPYDRDRLDRWIWRSGENHEYLSHEASITSMDLYPLLQHRMRQRRWKSAVQFENDHPDYLAAVIDEIAQRGPLSVSDLSDPGGRSGPWWGWSKGKLALEVLYVSGRLAIHERTKTFLTVYDLPERVIPETLTGASELDDAEAQRQMLLLSARSLGIGTATDIADYFRLKMPIARPLIEQLAADGALEPVAVPGWKDPAYLHPEAAHPRSVSAATFLSPFDPVVWCRPRAERLFDFTYRIEIYVPEPKRVYGYYVLPFLLDDRLVGRVDLKADRKAGLLLARSAFAEPGVDTARVARAMADQLGVMAEWLGLDGVEVSRRGDLASSLRAAVG